MIKKIVKLIKEISPYFGISLIYLLVFLLVVFLLTTISRQQLYIKK